MIPSIGSQVNFQYVDRHTNGNVFPTETLYAAEEYSGTVIGVRDTETSGLKWRTVRANPVVERSRYLITVQLSSGQIKSFYSGRMINLKIIKRKSWIRRMVGV